MKLLIYYASLVNVIFLLTNVLLIATVALIMIAYEYSLQSY
jgi:hypothetical protein